MPSHMPSSFASAAAGQASNRDSRSGRGEGRGSGDWPRSSNRPVNGTLTLRRTSNATHAQSASQSDPPPPTPGADAESAHQSSLAEQTADTRYSMTQLLEIQKMKHDSDPRKDVSQLFVNDWDPGNASGTNGRGGWNKSSDGRDPHSPYVCWDSNGEQRPISLEVKSESERSLFADVNAPSKPTQNNSKDQNAQGINGRKASMSHGSGNFGLSSPVASRPGTRRRETSDSISGLASPSGTGRFSRDEPSPFLTRKLTDWKDSSEDRDDSKHNSPFSTFTRSNTSGGTSGNGHTNPWSATSMSPMGNFGSFALGGQSANPPTPTDKRPGFGSMRGESRLAHLMHKETKENEEGPSRLVSSERSWRSRPRTDTDPFSNDNGPSGSAALGGGRDSPPLTAQGTGPGFDTPVRGASSDFGMSDVPGFRDNGRGQIHQTPQGHHNEQDQFSPAETNPYRSPPDERGDTDDTSYDGDSHQLGRLGGIPEHGSNAFGTLPRGFHPGADGSDRSQTSSTGAKGFSTLGGITSLPGFGSMGGWPTSGNAAGTPDRENRPGFPGAFGSSMFGAMGDLQSPGLGGLGGMFGSSSSGNLAGANSIGRGSKLGSLFPSAMQAQMQNAEMDSANEGDVRHSMTFGAIGKGTFPPSRDTESPMRTSRHAFEDIYPPPDSSRNQGPFTSSELSQPLTTTAFIGGSGQQSFQQSQELSESPSNQLPPAQQRTMVMPDRMRWVYLDPQGQVQGPFSGLEMHDWYKASFFSADLSVRKLEDTEFEPLGQLIRRIGNSREPFLVPQIGIPHGPPPMAQAGTPFTPTAATPGGAIQPGSVQPPFAGAFPSFGTTLTAEQQNNLERRKQEEQYLMARQREFLAQQQVNMKQMQMTGLPGALHHHSSAHSLQSQPSFGSMSSPIGMPPQSVMPGVAGFFDAPPRQLPAQGVMPSEFFREDELARLSFQERQQLAANVPLSQLAPSAQQSFGQNVDPQHEAARAEQARASDPQGFKARLHEFNQLRAQHDHEEAEQASAAAAAAATLQPTEIASTAQQIEHAEPVQHHQGTVLEQKVPEELTLTQQVAKAASAKQSPVPATEPVSPWGKVNPGLPTPFPPPQSTTPLPAPTAQRGRTKLPEALNVESRSSSETPEVVAAPTLAPWAKETVETSRGPSLKEIQEAEAKKAAKAEEAAAIARRLQLEQERKALSVQPVAPAPGLPTSSTWGNNGSPATPTNGPSAWAKPSTVKVPTTSSSTAAKKTLADIQREEELRKQKLAAAAAAAQPTAGVSGGKRYADLASKPTTGTPATGGAAWSTVGAGGKVRIPTGPAATVPQAVRSASSANVALPASRSVPRPAQAARSVTTTGQTGLVTAQDEFAKWAKAALAKGLNSDINVDEFFRSLAGFPSDVVIIADSVYANSQLMDGRHFAEEFIRRRKLADKGVIEPANTGSGNAFSTAGEKSASGWSEVAKKGPPKEEPTAGFKVVPNKKKGKK